MKVAPILFAVAALLVAVSVKSCDPPSQAERAALRVPKPVKPRPVATKVKPKCTENCPQTDDQTVVVSPIPGGVPMGGGMYMSVR